LPEDLEEQRVRLVAEIREAFGDVTREGGVSWSESEVLDHVGTEAQRSEARASDADKSWTELVDDESWLPYPGVGGFHFVDKIGFRYYIPAAMMKCIASGEDEGIAFVLTMRYPGDRRAYGERWSLLDERQCGCVARFLRYMIEVASSRGDDVTHRDWVEALESHWKQFG
jgi:hypothetical protein